MAKTNGDNDVQVNGHTEDETTSVVTENNLETLDLPPKSRTKKLTVFEKVQVFEEVQMKTVVTERGSPSKSRAKNTRSNAEVEMKDAVEEKNPGILNSPAKSRAKNTRANVEAETKEFDSPTKSRSKNTRSSVEVERKDVDVDVEIDPEMDSSAKLKIMQPNMKVEHIVVERTRSSRRRNVPLNMEQKAKPNSTLNGNQDAIEIIDDNVHAGPSHEFGKYQGSSEDSKQLENHIAQKRKVLEEEMDDDDILPRKYYKTSEPQIDKKKRSCVIM